MLEDYIKNVKKWPRPNSCKEMSSFLRFTDSQDIIVALFLVTGL